jgi:hypothetical protein
MPRGDKTMTPIAKIANKGDVRRGRRWSRGERHTVWDLSRVSDSKW